MITLRKVYKTKEKKEVVNEKEIEDTGGLEHMVNRVRVKIDDNDDYRLFELKEKKRIIDLYYEEIK